MRNVQMAKKKLNSISHIFHAFKALKCYNACCQRKNEMLLWVFHCISCYHNDDEGPRPEVTGIHPKHFTEGERLGTAARKAILPYTKKEKNIGYRLLHGIGSQASWVLILVLLLIHCARESTSLCAPSCSSVPQTLVPSYPIWSHKALFLNIFQVFWDLNDYKVPQYDVQAKAILLFLCLC